MASVQRPAPAYRRASNASRPAATAGAHPVPPPAPRSAGALASALITPFASRAATLLVLPAATAAIAFKRRSARRCAHRWLPPTACGLLQAQGAAQPAHVIGIASCPPHPCSTYHGGSLEAVLLRWYPDSGLFDCETAVTLQLGDDWPPAGGPAGLPPLLGWGASPRSDALLRLARGVPLWDCGRALVCTTNQATLEALLDNRRAAAWRDAAEHSGEAYIVKVPACHAFPCWMHAGGCCRQTGCFASMHGRPPFCCAGRQLALHLDHHVPQGRLGTMFASVEGFEGNTPGLRAALDCAAATAALF